MTSPIPAQTWQRAALSCGVLASILYGSMILFIRYEGYSLLSQVPSELTAIGAPTRDLWATLGAFYTALMVTFAIGVVMGASERRVRTMGFVLLAYAALGFLWPLGPMHQRSVLAAGGGDIGDTIHKLLAAVTVTLMFIVLSLASTAFGPRFRRFTVVSVVTLLLFGIVTFIQSPRLGAGLPTPWIGLYERLNIAVFLLWVIVLAIRLWPRRVDQHLVQYGDGNLVDGSGRGRHADVDAGGAHISAGS